MTTTTRSRRFHPSFDRLSLRLAPTNICPMVPTVLPPELPPEPVETCPMSPSLTNTVVEPVDTVLPPS